MFSDNQQPARPLAIHHGPFEITFTLTENRLVWENPALNYAKSLTVSSIVRLKTEADDGKLRVSVTSATEPNVTFTVHDNDEGNFLLCRLTERAALLRPKLKVNGYDFQIDRQNCLDASSHRFVLSLILLLATAVSAAFLRFHPVPLALCALTVLCAVCFFISRKKTA